MDDDGARVRLFAHGAAELALEQKGVAVYAAREHEHGRAVVVLGGRIAVLARQQVLLLHVELFV